jgi:hypothetical protein
LHARSWPLPRWHEPLDVESLGLFSEATERLDEGRSGTAEVHEDEPPPRLDAQVPEPAPLGRFGFAEVARPAKRTVGLEDPAVVATDERGRGTGAVVDEWPGAVRADVMERPELAVGAAGHHDREARHHGRQVRAGLEELRGVRDIQPGRGEDPSALAVELVATAVERGGQGLGHLRMLRPATRHPPRWMET